MPPSPGLRPLSPHHRGRGLGRGGAFKAGRETMSHDRRPIQGRSCDVVGGSPPSDLLFEASAYSTSPVRLDRTGISMGGRPARRGVCRVPGVVLQVDGTPHWSGGERSSSLECRSPFPLREALKKCRLMERHWKVEGRHRSGPSRRLSPWDTRTVPQAHGRFKRETELRVRGFELS